MSFAGYGHSRSGSRATRTAAKLGVVPIDGARLAELLSSAPPRQENTMKTATVTTPEAVTFDPWPGATARPAVNPPRPWQPPTAWGAMPPALREIFGGAALAVLAEHPNADKREIPRLAHLTWATAREVGFMFAGKATRVELAVREVPELSSPVLVLEELLRRLLEADDVLATLRSERSRLDAQIEKLERLRGRVA